MRRSLTTFVAAGAAALGLAVGGPGAAVPTGTVAPAQAQTGQAQTSQAAQNSQGSQDRVLKQYLKDTWKSFVAMTDEDTGLPADNVGGDLDPADRSGYTSPTNIGAYLWSTVVARDTGLITKADARARMLQTIGSIGKLEMHPESGQFYNWYDPATLEKLTTWPVNGDPVYPFVSSVDNGWLATGLLVAARADSQVTAAADAIRTKMDFGFYYDETAGVQKEPGGPVGGQISGGFWVEPPPGCSQERSFRAGTAPVFHTCHRYGAFNTEPRMASYLGIAAGQIPAKHYFGTQRTFPPICGYTWTETLPTGEWVSHEGVDVFEGTLPYRGMRIVPTWGGSMFEALMVPLFVPEEKWGPTSWGKNHPLYVQAQIEHGKEEAGYGYWGFSPSNNPDGGYREYGVDALGMDEAGYTSDQQRTDWSQPNVVEGCPDSRAGEPAPTEYGDGVVTPHASFLALRYAKGPALANLAKLKRNYDAYGPGGFYDAVEVPSGQVSKRYLSLDQGMIMAALGNALAGDDIRDYASTGALEDHVKPLMQQETFATASEGSR